jgi:hypothetical protein
MRFIWKNLCSELPSQNLELWSHHIIWVGIFLAILRQLEEWHKWYSVIGEYMSALGRICVLCLIPNQTGEMPFTRAVIQSDIVQCDATQVIGFRTEFCTIWYKNVIKTWVPRQDFQIISKIVPWLLLYFYCYCCYWPPLWYSGQSSWLHNGDVLCFLWGTNWIYICYVEESRPPLWYSGQSSWLHNRDVLCFLWVMNWIYICYVEESRPPLWYSGQSF